MPKSGYYYANQFALITLKSLEEVMGKNGLNAILNLAHLPHLVESYPPDNLEREFDFADYSALLQALEEMYGSRGGQGLALRVGRVAFADTLEHFGALAGVSDLASRVLPLDEKLRVGLSAMANIVSQISDQVGSVIEDNERFTYTVQRCPMCWGRQELDKPVCYVTTGLLQACLKWASEGIEFNVHESKCIAMGADVCEFVIPKAPIG
jgi:predicted hydrocarbon binding protein